MMQATIPSPPGVPLGASDIRRLRKASRLPLAWTASARRRRILLLVLAAPGFGLVASTPWIQSPGLLALGALMFAAALVFRRSSEPAFVRAEAAGLWPSSLPHKWEVSDV